MGLLEYAGFVALSVVVASRSNGTSPRSSHR